VAAFAFMKTKPTKKVEVPVKEDLDLSSLSITIPTRDDGEPPYAEKTP
jgi:hypothetical protein